MASPRPNGKRPEEKNALSRGSFVARSPDVRRCIRLLWAQTSNGRCRIRNGGMRGAAVSFHGTAGILQRTTLRPCSACGVCVRVVLKFFVLDLALSCFLTKNVVRFVMQDFVGRSSGYHFRQRCMCRNDHSDSFRTFRTIRGTLRGKDF